MCGVIVSGDHGADSSHRDEVGLVMVKSQLTFGVAKDLLSPSSLTLDFGRHRRAVHPLQRLVQRDQLLLRSVT